MGPMNVTTTASALAETVRTTATDIWNDSCAVPELEYAIANGATGATANPTIVHDVWRADPARWRAEVVRMASENATWSEREIAWAIVAWRLRPPRAECHRQVPDDPRGAPGDGGGLIPGHQRQRHGLDLGRPGDRRRRGRRAGDRTP
jgi:hypothetical protein